ncbi:putative malate dehydrogenase 1B [Paramormyrops kingsleyae]|uniref:Malate dehydrogenase 1B, NAD (soluble) n=1 Tax=Paramormyrops kingsleyae TaxID=1676925 RepID=A0A3B3RGW1_9TELE|nr:putative malate dehydrogenase 1B [Paramormyrops kingsleyae]
MAKFVLAGKADCPNYAKAEHLSDSLQRNLPNFQIHKICQHPKDWQQWLEATCKDNGWNHDRSPIVWRELIDRGGKGLLLGGLNEFLDHIQGYYGITSDMTDELMMKVAAENLDIKEQCMKDEVHCQSLIKPLHIWISSSLSPTCYHLIPLLLEPGMFRDSPKIHLHLLDVEGDSEALQGLRMEAEDMALPLLHKVTVHTSLEDAFHKAHLIITLDDLMSEEAGREQNMAKTAERFRKYGQLIDGRAQKEVRVIVAGNSFINLKCSVLLENAPSLMYNRFVALATQPVMEATAHIAQKLNVKSADVRNVILWGNVGGTCHIDLQKAKVFHYEGAVQGPPGFSQAVLEIIHDRIWLETDFLDLLSTHRAKLLAKTKRTAALSAASGIVAVLRAWNFGSAPGEILSLGVLSTGQFGIPAGLVFSLPVSFQHGAWVVPHDIFIDDHLKIKLQAAAFQLQAEKDSIKIQ